MQKIIIIGGKGTAVDIGEQIVNAREQYNQDVEFLGWAIDDESLGSEINGYPVLCKPAELAEKYRHSDVKFLFSLYKPGEMEERIGLLHSYGIEPSRFANFIHPMAYVAKSATMGFGNILLSNASIWSNTKLGNHNILYSYSAIGHDTQVGNNNLLVGGTVGGESILGNGIVIGIRASVKSGVQLADYAFVGMGAIVLRHVGPSEIVFGNPAKSIRT